MRNLLVAVAAVALALASTQLSACGGDTNSTPPDAGANLDPALACTGTCDCKTGLNCACASGATCTQKCTTDTCNVACANTAKCTVDAKADLNYACSNTSECTGTSGANAELACSNSAKCTGIVLQDSANVACSGQATCEVKVGTDSQIACSDSAVCTVTCNGSCTYACNGGAKCTCKGTCDVFACGLTGLPTTCSNGTKVCGQACP